MRLLTLKTIVILTVIAIGFMVAEPFVEETAEASCGFYPFSLCVSTASLCAYKTWWADFNCPGANDAGVQRCIELTEEAELMCDLSAIVCYHSE